jgi:hypothetical protein
LSASDRTAWLRYAGLAAIVTLWTSLGVGMSRTGLRLSDPEPLSYLGTDPRARFLFRGGLLLGALLLAGFSWFVHQRFTPPWTFLVASLVGLGGQVVAAMVPLSGPGSRPGVHTTAGLILGLSLPVLMWRFAAGQAPGRWRRQSYALFWLEVTACAVGVGLSRSMRAPVAEAVPAGAFHLWIMVVTFHSRRPPPVGAAPGPGPAGATDTHDESNLGILGGEP